MNSDPSERNAGIVITIRTAAAAKTIPFQRSVHDTAGAYMRIRNLLIGFFSSGLLLPTSNELAILQSHSGLKSNRFTLVSNRRRAGSSVMARTAATAIASVLV